MITEVDVLIIGAGISGMTAAYGLAQKSIQVLLIEETPHLGGKTAFYTHEIEGINNEKYRGFELVSQVKHNLQRTTVDIWLNHAAIGTYENGDIVVLHKNQTKRIRAKTVIVATGCYEKSIAFKGWTLPGVFKTQAIIKLLNKDFVRPGNKGIIVGYNALTKGLIELFELLEIKLEAIILHDTQKNKRKNIPSYVPVYTAKDMEAIGERRVQKMRIIDDNLPTKEIETDFICTAADHAPILEVTSILGCQIGFSELLQSFVPIVNSHQETSVSHVYALHAKNYKDLLAKVEHMTTKITENLKKRKEEIG